MHVLTNVKTDVVRDRRSHTFSRNRARLVDSGLDGRRRARLVQGLTGRGIIESGLAGRDGRWNSTSRRIMSSKGALVQGQRKKWQQPGDWHEPSPSGRKFASCVSQTFSGRPVKVHLNGFAMVSLKELMNARSFYSRFSRDVKWPRLMTRRTRMLNQTSI